MTWAKLGLAVFQFLNWLASLIRSNRDIELGERRSDDRHREADRIVRDAVERADPDSVSDDEAFGSGGSHNDLPRAQPLGFASYADRDGKGFDPREFQPDDEGPAEDAGSDQERTRVPLMQRVGGWILLAIAAVLVLILSGHFAPAQAETASWYQDGSRTANGEVFVPDAMTCAHRSIPFGTVLRLRWRGRSALCRVNDRGPWIAGRDLDVSRAVAARLGMIGSGVASHHRTGKAAIVKPVLPTEKHKQFRAELLALWNKFAGDLPADQMLALAAHSVGQLIAIQDQRRFTSKMVMKLVADNIEVGNKEVLDHLRWAEGGSA